MHVLLLGVKIGRMSVLSLLELVPFLGLPKRESKGKPALDVPQRKAGPYWLRLLRSGPECSDNFLHAQKEVLEFILETSGLPTHSREEPSAVCC